MNTHTHTKYPYSIKILTYAHEKREKRILGI
jgi:hypothetical protein